MRRDHHRGRPIVTATEKIMLTQSNQRHGNCMNCNLGKCIQRKLVGENMRTPLMPAQAARMYQKSRRSARQRFAAARVESVTNSSATAIQETMRLKASWSRSVV